MIFVIQIAINRDMLMIYIKNVNCSIADVIRAEDHCVCQFKQFYELYNRQYSIFYIMMYSISLILSCI